jgi:hypothetical protein
MIMMKMRKKIFLKKKMSEVGFFDFLCILLFVFFICSAQENFALLAS